jgi:RNA polymerase sigma factor (sigma-70 family)
MYPVKQPCTSDEFEKMLADYPKKELNAFTPLILSESKWVFNLAYQMLQNGAEAEEVRNDSLVKWIRQLAVSKNYQNATRAYLHTTVKNTVFDLLKKQKLKIVEYEPVIHNTISSLEHEVRIGPEQFDQLNAGLDELEEPCRSMIEMELEDKMTQKAILETLKIQHTPASVSGHFRNCRDKLRGIIFKKFKINING